MRASRSNTGKQKPLVEIRSPLRARAYRAKFRPFEATKYLDARALRSARKATIECGTLEFAGTRLTLEAEIERGMVVALRPIGCEGCAPRKARKVGSAALKKTMRTLARQLEGGGIRQPALPIPLRISSRRGFQIPFGPIIIVIGDWDFCVEVWIGDRFCWWCLFGPSGCIDFGPPF